MTGYIGMLKDLNLTQDQIDYATNLHTVIEFNSDVYCKGKSKINNTGIFALKNILKKETIGLGSIDNRYKTILGRYTNHSDNNNAMFYLLKNRDTIMVAEKDIYKGEEILINYRDHILDEKYL